MDLKTYKNFYNKKWKSKSSSIFSFKIYNIIWSFYYSLSLLKIVSPILVYSWTTEIPFDFRYSILPLASPFPYDIIAPACPIHVSAGAVCPQIKAATGFLNLLSKIQSEAFSSIPPPISPIIMTPLVSGSF